jgi:hypothetical protein
LTRSGQLSNREAGSGCSGSHGHVDQASGESASRSGPATATLTHSLSLLLQLDLITDWHEQHGMSRARRTIRLAQDALDAVAAPSVPGATPLYLDAQQR